MTDKLRLGQAPSNDSSRNVGFQTDRERAPGQGHLASIVFAVIVLNEQLPGEDTIMATVVCTIVLSVAAHGLSAHPLVAKLVKGGDQGRRKRST